MVGALRASACLLAASIACGVDIETPADLRIRCVDGDDCPTGRCSVTVDVCIAADDDDSPLRVISVEALDSRRIVVLFNRVVDPVSAADYTVYALSPALSPESAVVADDRLSVTVQTTQQKLRTYLLDVVDVFDPIGRPLERTQREFTGIGEQVSGQAPTPLSPPDRTLFAEPSVTLTWSALEEAVNYAVEVVRETPSGDVPIEGSPFILRGTELTLSVAADATYSWRVTADISREPPVTSSFAVFGEAVHVYCAASADCASPESWDAGTSAKPMRRIGRALALGAFLSRPELRIAGRGGGAVYEEALILGASLARVSGGYDPTFTVVDPVATPTVIRGDPAAVRVVTNARLEMVDLELHAGGGAALVLTGIDDFTATRLTLRSTNGARPLDARRCTPGRVASFFDLRAGVLLGSGAPAAARVAGACEALFDHAALEGAGIEVTRASATFLDSSIVATDGRPSESQGYSGIDITAVRADGGAVIMERSVVRAGVDDDASNRVALLVRDGGNVRVNASNLVAARVGSSDCFPQNCQGGASALIVNPTGDLFEELATVEVIVTNTVLVSSAQPSTPDLTASTVQVGANSKVSLIHDIIYVRDGTGIVAAAQAPSGDLQLLNSAVVCEGSSTGADNLSSVPPRLLRASAFVGCATPYRRQGVSYTTATAIETISDPAPHTFTGLHVFGAPVVATFPFYSGADGTAGTADDDWSCSAACSELGEPSQADICGASGAGPCAAQVTQDSVGAMRTLPVSLGPREVD